MKKLVKIVLMSLVLTLLLSVGVQAETIKKKITIKKDGWYEFYTTTPDEKEVSQFISLYKGKRYIFSDFIYNGTCHFEYLKKGKYTMTSYVPFLYSKVPISKSTINYSAKKATLLKSSTALCLDIKKYEGYNKWYKIKVAKNQRLKVFCNSYCDIYDKNMMYVSTNYTQDGFLETAELKAGTYYIRATIYPSVYRQLIELIVHIE